MKRIKYLFIIAAVLLLPLVHVSESHAIIEDTVRYTNSLGFKVNNSATSVSMNFGVGDFQQYTAALPGNYSFTDLRVNLGNTVNITNNKFFRILLKIDVVSSTFGNVSVTCPSSYWQDRYQNRNCEIISHTHTNLLESGDFVDNGGSKSSSLNAYGLDYNETAEDSFIVQLDIYNTNGVTVSQVPYSGQFLGIRYGGPTVLVKMSVLQSLTYRDETSSETEAIQDQTDKVQEQIDRDNQDRSDMESQQSDSESSADDTAEAITSASDSLLAVIGNFVNIIINPPQRDCTINGDMGHMDLGAIDLCQLSPPPAISTIATLLVIGFVIPFAYGIISTILNLLKGATQ